MERLKITVKGVSETKRALALLTSNAQMRGLSAHVAERLTEFVRDHLDEMSHSRHRTADRLGAKHTHHFEYASGRVDNKNADGLKQDTQAANVSASGFTISVMNTPGLYRAFGPVTIKPKRTKWLTIPLHKSSYGKRVADLRREGHVIFRPGKARILAEADGKKLRPLFALCKQTTLPEDKGLLPTREALLKKSIEESAAYIKDEIALG